MSLQLRYQKKGRDLVFERLKPLLEVGLDLVFPPVCVCCYGSTLDHHQLCARCWGKLTFISSPKCAQCGYPFPYDLGEAAKCLKCLRHPPLYASMQSLLVYDSNSSPLIISFKYGDKLFLTKIFCRLLSGLLEELACVIEKKEPLLVVPVPLHWLRQFFRHYNQAAFLCKGLFPYVNALFPSSQYLPDCIVRTRYTGSQKGKNVERRARNVRKAFALSWRHRKTIENRIVLVVDDIVASSATVNEVVKVCLKGGARAVHILSLARTMGRTSNHF